MVPYLVLCVMILIVEMITRNKWVVCFTGCVGLWFLLAFRNLSMGLSDTLGTYKSIFDVARSLSWSQITSSTNYPRSFIPFVFFTKFCQLWMPQYRFFVMFIAALTVIPICCVIYHYSTNATVSLFIYIGILYCYDFYLLRQMIALSLIISVCYPALFHHHLGKFVIGALLATCIHPTAAVILLLLPLIETPFTFRKCLMLLCISLIGTLSPSIVMQIVNFFDFTGRITTSLSQGIYSGGNGHVPISFFVYAFILMLCMVSYTSKERVFKNDDLLLWPSVNPVSYAAGSRWLLWALGFGIMFQGFIGVVTEFYRVAIYFLPSLLFIIPERIKKIQDPQYKSAISFALCILMGIYAVGFSLRNTGCLPYRFGF